MSNRIYKMAVAFLQFKQAYSNLVDASLAMPDLDVSDAYPFYLLDFETIEPAVRQWCNIHSSRLMKLLPERVDNPTCLSCSFLRAGTGPDGFCKGLRETNCGVHPTILFSKEAVAPFLTSVGVDINKLDDEAMHLIYIQRSEEAYEQTTKKADRAGD